MARIWQVLTSGMSKYIIVRLLQIVLVLYLYMTLVFIILEAQPGDITDIYVGNPKITPEAREAIIKQLGLDKPLHERYLNYLKNFVTGHLGCSFKWGNIREVPDPVCREQRPTWDLIKERLPRTVLLFLTYTIISFYIGFFLGKLIAWRRGAIIEYFSTVVGVVLFTVFTPWFALLLVWIFAVNLGIVPIGGFINPDNWRVVERVGTVSRDMGVSLSNVVFNYILMWLGGLTLVWGVIYLVSQRFPYAWQRRVARWGSVCIGLLAMGAFFGGAWPGSADQAVIASETRFNFFLWQLEFPAGTIPLFPLALDFVQHMILPILTLTLISFAGTMLLMRNTMLETMREDYVMAAKAKGLPDQVVRDKHAARNALLPVVTSLIFAIAFSVDGGVFTETIFSWPGMGKLLLESAIEQDYPVAIGTLVFTGIFALVAHLIADILYAFLDPRIRYD
ncbi:MAG: ABC transporter permease [Candidatus Bipolaricaulota bacterium]|nr:ABC transporter permease [Candidatus Bipolaricaulota bacterium]MDW8030294.1 ABC transporter permease [Candidatus Bipolaricaulota bacterium]